MDFIHAAEFVLQKKGEIFLPDDKTFNKRIVPTDIIRWGREQFSRGISRERDSVLVETDPISCLVYTGDDLRQQLRYLWQRGLTPNLNGRIEKHIVGRAKRHGGWESLGKEVKSERRPDFLYGAYMPAVEGARNEYRSVADFWKWQLVSAQIPWVLFDQTPQTTAWKQAVKPASLVKEGTRTLRIDGYNSEKGHFAQFKYPVTALWHPSAVWFTAAMMRKHYYGMNWKDFFEKFSVNALIDIINENNFEEAMKVWEAFKQAASLPKLYDDVWDVKMEKIFQHLVAKGGVLAMGRTFASNWRMHVPKSKYRVHGGTLPSWTTFCINSTLDTKEEVKLDANAVRAAATEIAEKRNIR